MHFSSCMCDFMVQYLARGFEVQNWPELRMPFPLIENFLSSFAVQANYVLNRVLIAE